MISFGTKLKLPKGFYFANIGDKDYYPLARGRTVTVSEDQGDVIVCTTGDAWVEDLIKAGIIRRDGNGELFVVETGKAACNAPRIDQNFRQGNDKG